MASPTYLQTCGACGSNNLYTAVPSGVLYCYSCGCKADSKPARSIPVDKRDLDKRRIKPALPPRHMKPVCSPERPAQVNTALTPVAITEGGEVVAIEQVEPPKPQQQPQQFRRLAKGRR